MVTMVPLVLMPSCAEPAMLPLLVSVPI